MTETRPNVNREKLQERTGELRAYIHPLQLINSQTFLRQVRNWFDVKIGGPIRHATAKATERHPLEPPSTQLSDEQKEKLASFKKRFVQHCKEFWQSWRGRETVLRWRVVSRQSEQNQPVAEPTVGFFLYTHGDENESENLYHTAIQEWIETSDQPLLTVDATHQDALDEGKREGNDTNLNFEFPKPILQLFPQLQYAPAQMVRKLLTEIFRQLQHIVTFHGDKENPDKTPPAPNEKNVIGYYIYFGFPNTPQGKELNTQVRQLHDEFVTQHLLPNNFVVYRGTDDPAWGHYTDTGYIQNPITSTGKEVDGSLENFFVYLGIITARKQPSTFLCFELPQFEPVFGADGKIERYAPMPEERRTLLTNLVRKHFLFRYLQLIQNFAQAA